MGKERTRFRYVRTTRARPRQRDSLPQSVGKAAALGARFYLARYSRRWKREYIKWEPDMAYKIQQLGIGGILDQAIAITKDHFVLLLSIMLLLMIPYNLVAGLISLAIMPAPSFMPTPEQMAEIQAAQLRNWPILAAIGLIGGLVVLPVTNAAVIWAVARLYLGQQV